MQDNRESVKQPLPREAESIAGFAAESEEMQEIRLYATGHVKSIKRNQGEKDKQCAAYNTYWHRYYSGTGLETDHVSALIARCTSVAPSPCCKNARYFARSTVPL